MSTLKIATYNINGVVKRLANLLQWLQAESPDVVCLQESKSTDRDFPGAAIKAAGYEAIWHGQKTWNGVAILAKGSKPIETRRGLPGDPKDEQARYLEAAVNGVIVACLYLPNGNPQPGPKFDYKLAWFERFNRHAQALIDTRHPVALVGDYNVVPTDFDIYNTRSWSKNALLQPQSRAMFSTLLSQGWCDAIRAVYPRESVYTFWDYLRGAWERNAGLRIDHLLLSPTLAPRLAAAGVDTWVRGKEGASDHAPAWITLKTA
ncbi:MAG: exodeoxyribonuclease III [Deltaproteobacteria bacterium]|nr:exodeoxyribonuclease III [Deltaproteobacteria bacterium]